MAIINNRQNPDEPESFDSKKFPINSEKSADSRPVDPEILDTVWKQARDEATNLRRSGMLGQAASVVRDAIAVLEPVVEADDFRVAFLRFDVADLLIELGTGQKTPAFREAIQYLEQSAPVFLALFGADSFMYCYSQYRLSLCYLYTGDRERGFDLFEKALSGLIAGAEKSETDSALVARCFRELAEFQKNSGSCEDAIKTSRRGINFLEARRLPDVAPESAENAFRARIASFIKSLEPEWKRKTTPQLEKIAGDVEEIHDLRYLSAKLLTSRALDEGNYSDALNHASIASAMLLRGAAPDNLSVTELFEDKAAAMFLSGNIANSQLLKVEEDCGNWLRVYGQTWTPDPHQFWYKVARRLFKDEHYEVAREATNFLNRRTAESDGPYSRSAFHASVLTIAVLQNLHYPEELEYTSKKAAIIAEKLFALSSDDYVHSAMLASRMSAANSSMDDALQYAEKAVSGFEQKKVQNVLTRMEVYENLALQQFSAGKLEEALTSLEEAITAAARGKIPDDQHGRLFIHRAVIERYSGNNRESNEALLRAEDYVNIENPQNVSTALYWYSARIQLLKTEGAESLEVAESVAEVALELARSHYSSESTALITPLMETAEVYFKRAHLYADREVAEQALLLLKEAEAIASPRGLENFTRVKLLSSIGEVMEFLGETDSAPALENEHKLRSLRSILDLKNEGIWGDTSEDS